MECVNWHRELNRKKVDFSGFAKLDVLKKINSSPDIKHDRLESMVAYLWKDNAGLEKAVVAAEGDMKAELQKLLDKMSVE